MAASTQYSAVGSDSEGNVPSPPPCALPPKILKRLPHAGDTAQSTHRGIFKGRTHVDAMKGNVLSLDCQCINTRMHTRTCTYSLAWTDSIHVQLCPGTSWVSSSGFILGLGLWFSSSHLEFFLGTCRGQGLGFNTGFRV